MRRDPIVRFQYGYGPVYSHKCRGYGLSNLVGDFVLTISTVGLWLIWVFIREVTR